MAAPPNDRHLDVTIVPVASSSFTTRNFDRDLLAANNALYDETDAILTTNDDPATHFTQKNHMRILKKVRTALKIARVDFGSKKEMTAQLYGDAKYTMQKNGSTNYYHYKWLPSQSLVWYNETVAKLEKDKRVFVLLPTLRHWLTNFSVTLKQMLQFNKTPNSEFYTVRKSILTDLYQHLMAVLAEVEMSPIFVGRARQLSTDETLAAVVVGDGTDWDPNPDHTTMLIQDWGVLTTYYRFLKDWMIISREMVHDQRNSDDGEPAVVTAVVTGTTTAIAVTDASELLTASGITTELLVTSGTTGAAPLKRQSSSPLYPRCIRHGSGGARRRKSSNLRVLVKSSLRRRY